MVLFLVLYLVVYSLTYWTTMESQIAKVRRGDAQGQDALYSVACFLGSLIIEDLSQDLQEGQSGGGDPAAAPGPGAGGGGREGGGAPEGQFVPLELAGAGGAGASSVQWIDYLRENVFAENRQTVGEVNVKAKIIDNESRININRVFELAKFVRANPSDPANAEGGVALDGVAEDELVAAVAGSESSAAAAGNLERLARGETSRSSRTTIRGTGGAETGPDAASTALDTETAAQLGLQEDVELAQFEEPTEEQIQDATEILKRAIWVMISLNVDHGFEYEGSYASIGIAERVASDIVDYILARRRSPVQNILYHPSELLNVPSVTSELYYGPAVGLAKGQEREFEALGPDGQYYTFILRRDEFGDLVSTPATYLDPDAEFRREEESRLLADLQDRYDLGRFAELPGMGLGRLSGSGYTRGMEEPTILYDENGIDGAVLEGPLPLGLEDILCTFSTGKININTAPVPVLYALLLSLEEGLSEANDVAVGIADYRQRLQDVEESAETADDTGAGSTARGGSSRSGAGSTGGGRTGSSRAGSGRGASGRALDEDQQAPELGQPRRTLPEEDEEQLGTGATGAAGSAGALADEALGQLGSAYQDLETNYFTNLQQLELIDGYDEGPQDLLRSDLGVDRVSEEQDSLLQQVINDYTNATVFGSTYFTFDVKANLPGSPLVKSVYVIVKRDPSAKLLEYVLWKEIE
jgi:hypothetical protein